MSEDTEYYYEDYCNEILNCGLNKVNIQVGQWGVAGEREYCKSPDIDQCTSWQ
jgi:hypothetical protein